jgi:hypothetical protein
MVLPAGRWLPACRFLVRCVSGVCFGCCFSPGLFLLLLLRLLLLLLLRCLCHIGSVLG